MSKILEICDRIYRIPATDIPLSADIGIVVGKTHVWLYDVGACPDTVSEVTSFNLPINCVLSHFHPDHVGGLAGIAFEKVYLSANTYKYVGLGEKVAGDVTFDDGIKIHIFELPSSHAKGSLGLEAGDYCFLGDALYPTQKAGREVYNTGLLLEQIKKLRSLSARYFLLSHDERFVFPHEEVLGGLERLYSRRDKNSPYISA